MRHASIFLALVVLTACASSVPPAIRQAPAQAPTLTAVLSNIDAHRGQTVRWGGNLVAVDNREQDSVIEIVARRLDSYGEPRLDDHSQGRFLARVQGFVDPEVYKSGRLLTIAGVIEAAEERKIGTYNYRYPRVLAHQIYLWPQQQSTPPPYPYYYPYWYDPWYPWYPRPWYWDRRYPYRY